MRLLLDTHVVRWWLSDSPPLGPEARDTVADPDNMVYVSVVSIWETVVKRSLGKLEVPDYWAGTLAEEPFRASPVTWKHALGVGRLPEPSMDGHPGYPRCPGRRLMIRLCDESHQRSLLPGGQF